MNKKGVILLNNLFSGEYIKDKLGGEIINMYQSDNGKHYVYVNPYGNVGKEWDNKIEHVLFFRSIGNGIVKIIGKAEISRQICLNAVRKINTGIDKHQKTFIDRENITYGGCKVYEIGSWSNYFVTFEAKNIYRAKKDIYLSVSKSKIIDSNKTVVLESIKRINNTSQKKYIGPEHKDYEALEQLINTQNYWENETVGKIQLKSNRNLGNSLLSIIQKENDELVNSNLLCYFLANDTLFWNDFTNQVLKIKNISTVNITPKITRESIGNIDIYIETEKHIIVIENKIKSGISGNKESGYSQLGKYVEIAEKENTSNKTLHFYILRPNYNNEDYHMFKNGERYMEIKYSEILEIIKDRNSNHYFEELKQVVKKHSSEYNNEHFEIMNDRFIEQIKKSK